MNIWIPSFNVCYNACCQYSIHKHVPSMVHLALEWFCINGWRQFYMWTFEFQELGSTCSGIPSVYVCFCPYIVRTLKLGMKMYAAEWVPIYSKEFFLLESKCLMLSQYLYGQYPNVLNFNGLYFNEKRGCFLHSVLEQ